MGVAYLLCAASLWGAIGPVSRWVFEGGFTPLETAFWRGNIAGLAFLVHFFLDRKITLNRRHLPGIIVFGVFGVAVLEGSYVYAVKFGGAALASVLLYSAPIWVNLASWRFFGENIQKGQWLALLLTFIGVTGVCLWGAQVAFSPAALMWGLASALGYALFYISGRVFFRRSHPVAVYMVAFPTGSLAILPIMMSVDGHTGGEIFSRMANMPSNFLIPLFCLGFVSTYIAYMFYGAGLRQVAPGQAAIITTVEPVISIILARVVWGERLSVAGYFFAALVLTGVAVSALISANKVSTNIINT